MSNPNPKQTRSERHMAENQVAFRRLNEQLSREFQELAALAKEDQRVFTVEMPRGRLRFKCECADKNCIRRVCMTLNTWDRIHKDPRRFCIFNGHTIDKIEKVVETHPGYEVVEKFVYPRQNVTRFWNTRAHFV